MCSLVASWGMHLSRLPLLAVLTLVSVACAPRTGVPAAVCAELTSAEGTQGDVDVDVTGVITSLSATPEGNCSWDMGTTPRSFSVRTADEETLNVFVSGVPSELWTLPSVGESVRVRVTPGWVAWGIRGGTLSLTDDNGHRLTFASDSLATTEVVDVDVTATAGWAAPAPATCGWQSAPPVTFDSEDDSVVLAVGERGTLDVDGRAYDVALLASNDHENPGLCTDVGAFYKSYIITWRGP